MNINFTYLKQSPHRYTFRAPKIKQWTEKQCQGVTLNLFAGQTILNIMEVRVDIDKNMPAGHHMDAYDFVKQNIKNKLKFDTVILDPPWNYRKAREKYNGKWIGRLTKLKNILPQILNKNGRVISWGYSSTGMSQSRGFRKIAICLVCYSGDFNDSIGLTEIMWLK